ncbi:MAG TPA: Crp/Fnr family transcriptional regulator [Gammaproteobacteria bacterium]|nr:Crp/Fnr family transcriptional regulator [Gammaproteobacteria bacterium]
MSDIQEQLLACLQTLSAEEQRSLLDFARYLAERNGAVSLPYPTQLAPVAAERKPEPPPEPRDIERPESEKVVAAIKRLSQTYFMLDKTRMLGHTSGLMTQHIMAGRDAREVIDELEEIFRREYDEMRARHEES